ncbi:MAG: RidA family protein [Lachnospiraceae bacterium]|nr:RidA family protein [Lachnospiraceae bacterium]
MIAEKKLQELGYSLPDAIKPQGAYVPGVIAGDFAYTSGQTCRVNGELHYKGKVGNEVSLMEAQEAARICAVNCLGILKGLLGDLDRVEQIVHMVGYVASADGFVSQTQAIDGASLLLRDVFGELGVTSRSAIGVYALPGNAPCELEMVVKVKG